MPYQPLLEFIKENDLEFNIAAENFTVYRQKLFDYEIGDIFLLLFTKDGHQFRLRLEDVDHIEINEVLCHAKTDKEMKQGLEHLMNSSHDRFAVYFVSHEDNSVLIMGNLKVPK